MNTFTRSQIARILVDSASYAITASYALNGGGGGTGTPGGSNTQIQYNAGGGNFGGVPTLTYDGTTLRGTGSFTGSFTGLFNGSISNAVTASYALTASYVQNSISASYASTASYVLNAISASYARTASYVVSASYALSSSYVLSSSYALSASYVLSSSYALSSSFVTSASYALSSSYAVTSSVATKYPNVSIDVVTTSSGFYSASIPYTFNNNPTTIIVKGSTANINTITTDLRLQISSSAGLTEYDRLSINQGSLARYVPFTLIASFNNISGPGFIILNSIPSTINAFSASFYNIQGIITTIPR